MSNDDDNQEWTVPVNGNATTIRRIPDKDCEQCAKCKVQLGAMTHRGRRRVKKRMDGVGEDGKASSVVLRTSESLYYCSPRCLESHGAVEESELGF